MSLAVQPVLAEVPQEQRQRRATQQQLPQQLQPQPVFSKTSLFRKRAQARKGQLPVYKLQTTKGSEQV